MLFVDDTIVFYEASLDQVNNLCWLLIWFEAISGLKINLEKSEMIPISLVDNLMRLASEIGCKVGKLPLSYLGLPLRASYKLKAVWDDIEKQLHKKLPL